MQLKIIGTGSKGNAYLLENEEEALLIECGVPFKEINKAIDFNFKKLQGCILTHEHNDHAMSANDLLSSGVYVWATEKTHEALGTVMHHRACVLQRFNTDIIGNFKVMPFDVKHDAADPCGFLIYHPDTGTILFITDASYCKYRFGNLNNIIVEANYDTAIAKKKLSEMEFLRNRILQSHMSLDTCVDLLKANDLSKVNNIVLIHLSDSNSDEQAFNKRVSDETGKNVTVASNGMEINFNKTPF